MQTDAISRSEEQYPIDGEELFNRVQKLKHYEIKKNPLDDAAIYEVFRCQDVLDAILASKRLDVAQVVHGEFERQPEEVFPCIRANPVLCKTCNTTFITLNKEGKKHICCPYCGARMDGVYDG